MSSSLQIAAEKARAPRGWSGSTRILIVVGLSRPPPTGGAGSRCSSRCFMSAVRASHWQRSYSPLSPACIVFLLLSEGGCPTEDEMGRAHCGSDAVPGTAKRSCDSLEILLLPPPRALVPEQPLSPYILAGLFQNRGVHRRILPILGDRDRAARCRVGVGSVAQLYIERSIRLPLPPCSDRASPFSSATNSV